MAPGKLRWTALNPGWDFGWAGTDAAPAHIAVGLTVPASMSSAASGASGWLGDQSWPDTGLARGRHDGGAGRHGAVSAGVRRRRGRDVAGRRGRERAVPAGRRLPGRPACSSPTARTRPDRRWPTWATPWRARCR
ncbi:hypothetical protein [Microbacterium elymi]|uniref:Uncharacterized protein n=1 Tax=Microbacterium elymi TaxID=2909587 RepID=A0ABY5NJ64_9MICO|nr:hypothetical protein [Microbacterium elymi]UUT35126.1 hypothetical protein L2X98_33265 [Microbacterium elymi]